MNRRWKWEEINKPMARNSYKGRLHHLNEKKKYVKENHMDTRLKYEITQVASYKSAWQGWPPSKPTSPQCRELSIEKLCHARAILCAKVFGPWLLAWSPPLAWSGWKCGEQKLGCRQKEVWPKDSEGKKRRGDETEGSQSRLVRWFSVVGKRFGTSQTKLSSHYPLPTTTKPTHIIPRIHPLPPSELWGGDICGNSLAGKQCVLQFAPWSLQRQTRLRSLPQGHWEVMHLYTHWHILHSLNAN